MKKNQTSLFKDYKEKSNAYNLALNTLYFDIATIAPKDGLSYRNRMLSILSGEAFSHDTSSENVALIEEMARNKENSKELQKELDLLLRDLSDIRVLPKEVYISFTQLKADSQNAWEKAKEANDYQIFKPYLIQIIEKQKEILTYVNKTCSDYDYLLDRYQEGLDIKTYDKFFNKIKEELLPFIKRIQSEGKRINQQILLQPYPVEKQRAFMDILIKHLEADQKKCYITTSEHPFTEFFSTNETRITTHYHENNVMSAIFSTIHEYGHANYGLHVNPDFEGTTLQKAIGFAMHESQSRFLENHIGRNPHFWMPLYPKLQAHFPEHLNDVSFDAFMEMINVSEPSFIRTEADELTYPIHILIRYELEKAIFDGEVDYEQLDTMWNDKYEEYLGIRPSNDAEGILQDMHWGASNFGYFPTYALGSAFAAQFYHQMEKELDVNHILEHGEFKKIYSWLANNIHQYGALKSAEEIMMDTTKEAFDSMYYIHYLKEKYAAIYDIK